MISKISSFADTWKYESESTLKVLSRLTDESLGQAIVPGGRTLGRLAWHLVETMPEMLGRTGLRVEGPEMGARVPSSAARIAVSYETAAASVLDQVTSNWTDETLDVQDDMYGEMWTRGVTLGALVAHQSHHRGQMTVLMRQAGLRVPGVYGPAREEWAELGMPALD